MVIGARERIGLAPAVRYRVELGFAFVDDGERVIKMPAGVLERLAGGVCPSEDPALRDVMARFPTVFAAFTSAEIAQRSLAAQGA